MPPSSRSNIVDRFNICWRKLYRADIFFDNIGILVRCLTILDRSEHDEIFRLNIHENRSNRWNSWMCNLSWKDKRMKCICMVYERPYMCSASLVPFDDTLTLVGAQFPPLFIKGIVNMRQSREIQWKKFQTGQLRISGLKWSQTDDIPINRCTSPAKNGRNARINFRFRPFLTLVDKTAKFTSEMTSLDSFFFFICLVLCYSNYADTLSR